MSWVGRIIATLAVTAAAAQAQVVLNFDDLTFTNYDPIPADYGANLDPHLTAVNYRTLNSDYLLYANYVELWDSNYGDLSKVTYPASNGFVGEIMFVPAAGYGIQLISFDMAGWSNVDRSNSVMQLVDGNGAVLYNFAAGGSVAIEGDFTGNRHSSFTPNFLFAGTLGIQWGNDWNVGIDNIQFQLVPIPKPGAVALSLGLATAIAGLGHRCARCRSARA